MARRSRSQPNPRGEESRQRLIEAALDVFGLYGFEGASTRQLAARADVNISAIPYYFGSKEGLYAAVAEHIAAEVERHQGAVMARIREGLEAPALSPDKALVLLDEIVDSFAAMLIGSGDAERWARFVMREQMDPTPAFDILYDRIMGRLHALCSRLVACIIDRPEDDPETLIRTTTIVGQILVFRAARGTALRRLGWKDYDEGRIAAIRTIIKGQVRAALLAADGGLRR